MEQTDRIQVFLIDDHAVVREGVRSILEASGDVEVVGEAGTCEDAIRRLRAVHPRVAVIDVQLPDGSGTELCRDIRSEHPDVACLMLTSFAKDDALFESIMAGASGFVLKQIRLDELVVAVRRVAAGESLIDPTLVGKLLERIRHPATDVDPRLASLTPLERSILKLLVEGLTNREIAPHVHMSEKTVKNYVSSILHKLGLSRRTEAAVFALRPGFDVG
ncbi:MAG: response regulator [Actinomycetes bacterium]